MIGYYLTHPQVKIDADIPVPDWSLSEIGRNRVQSILSRPWLKTIRRVVSSDVRKAIETAEPIASALGLSTEIEAGMGENDRSATGFIPPEVFEAAADTFFAHPNESFRGWERAIDAQARIVSGVERVLAGHDANQPILFVGHGGVGTLLKCHLAGQAIARHDQPAGGGNLYAFRLESRVLLCDWTAMERFNGVDIHD